MLSDHDSEGIALAVTLCSVRDTNGKMVLYYDPTRVILPTDHPFVKHSSFLLYARPIRIDCSNTGSIEIDGRVVRKEKMNDYLLRTVQSGLFLSSRTQLKDKEYLASQIVCFKCNSGSKYIDCCGSQYRLTSSLSE